MSAPSNLLNRGGDTRIYAVPNFAVLLVASALWGLGYTFTSGATQAWLADEMSFPLAVGW